MCSVSSLITRALTSESSKHWKYQGCFSDVINNILSSSELVEIAQKLLSLPGNIWSSSVMGLRGMLMEVPALRWPMQLVQYRSSKE